MKVTNALRLECRRCESNVNGQCVALETTTWLKKYKQCPFLATKERLAEDRRLLQKAIEEGRVDPSNG